MNPIILQSGLEVWTGLQKPATLACAGWPVYEDNFPMYEDSQIEEIIGDFRREPAEDLFPASTWITRQVNNACAGFATASALSRIRRKRGQETVILSGDYCYCHINGGWDNGALLKDALEQVKIGIAPASLVPVGTFKKSKLSREATEAAPRFAGIEAYVTRSRRALYSGVAAGFCGIVAVHVGRNFSELDSFGNVPPNRGVGNHAVCVDDVVKANGKLRLRMPNSWGTQWGMSGVGLINWEDHLEVSSEYHVFWLVRSAGDDPKAINPPAPVQ